MDWKKTLQKIVSNIFIGVISLMGMKAAKNVMDGKDVLGRKIVPKTTKTDYRGDIHLGTDDYEVD